MNVALIADSAVGCILATINALRYDYRQCSWLYSCHYLCITPWLQTVQLAVFLPLFMNFALITESAAGCILATIYALRHDYRQCSWLYSCHYLCITPWLQTVQLAVFLSLFMNFALIADSAAGCILVTIYEFRPDCRQCSSLYSCHYLCITPWLQTMQLAVFLPLFMHYALIAYIAAGCILAFIYALSSDYRQCSWLYSCHYLCITPLLQTMQLAVFLPLFMHYGLIADNAAGCILATIYVLRPDYRQYSWLYSCHYLCITPWLQTMQLAVFLPLFIYYALITDNTAGCILATIYVLRPDCRQCSWLYSCHYLCITPWLQTIQLAVFLALFMYYALIADNAAGCILATIYALRLDCRQCSWLYSCHYLWISPWLQTMQLAVILPLFMHYALITDNAVGFILDTIYALRYVKYSTIVHVQTTWLFG